MFKFADLDEWERKQCNQIWRNGVEYWTDGFHQHEMRKMLAQFFVKSMPTCIAHLYFLFRKSVVWTFGISSMCIPRNAKVT